MHSTCINNPCLHRCYLFVHWVLVEHEGTLDRDEGGHRVPHPSVAVHQEAADRADGLGAVERLEAVDLQVRDPGKGIFE